MCGPNRVCATLRRGVETGERSSFYGNYSAFHGMCSRSKREAWEVTFVQTFYVRNQ